MTQGAASGPRPQIPPRLQSFLDALLDKKANDIVVVHVSEISGFADYLVICHGSSSTHLQALSESVGEIEKPQHREGGRKSDWILLDYGSVVIHLFTYKIRELYRLEALWSEGQSYLYNDDRIFEEYVGDDEDADQASSRSEISSSY